MATRKGARYKKGQAALEYLVTYGWALIVIMGIIAVLYSYIFKPEFYVVESCSMAPGIECGTFTLAKSTDGSNSMMLNLNLRSSMDFAIKIREMNITTDKFLSSGTGSYSSSTCTGRYCTATIPLSTIVARGDIPITFTFPLEEVKEIPRPATLQRMQFSILYEIVETGSVHRTAGILNVKVS